MRKNCDFLVIGSGLSGLFYALKVAEHGRVLILAKGRKQESNSYLAQGGVAATVEPSSSFEQHIEDTLKAGAGLCHPDVVKQAIEQAPTRIKDLVDMGVHFDGSTDRNFALAQEGGHLEKRVLHVQDHTGKAIQEVLLKRVQEHPNIEVLENSYAIDLLTTQKLHPFAIGSNKCIGAYVFQPETQNVLTVLSRWTVLATGGAGKVYLFTSNWSGATGDGIAMAYRAGARIANLEFMQFHPTCLYHPEARNFLISEAVRGEGGELINLKGEAFMKNHHPLGSLAPRDIVARSIDAEMKQTGAPSVFLDITNKSEGFLRDRFPVIFDRCKRYGIDMSQSPIPVVPAAHYLCGGVLANSRGETDISNLLVVGESACNGFHGANRLASNSLLDCLVFSHNAAELSVAKLAETHPPEVTPEPWQFHSNQDGDEMIVISHMWDEIRQLMWNYVGIVRSTKRLQRAQHRLANILTEIHDYYWNFRLHTDILELRNIALIADLTVKCALQRKDSVGIHYNIDHPTANGQIKDRVFKDTVMGNLI